MPHLTRPGPARDARRIAAAALVAAALAALPRWTAAGPPARPASRPADRLAEFVGALSPYGEWLTIGGDRAWRPTGVEEGWRPYFHGSWTWTEQGWFWVSHEPWGWATYHYGRWRFHPSLGWVWLPGTAWAPAWVTWRQGEGVVGWAPRIDAPAGSLPAFWTFVPAARLVGEHVESVALPAARVPALLLRTRPASGHAEQAATSRTVPSGRG